MLDNLYILYWYICDKLISVIHVYSKKQSLKSWMLLEKQS